MFSFWIFIAWLKVTKWIFDLEHLQTLVEVISLLKFLAHPETGASIGEFLKLANQVLQHGSHFSKWEVYRLRTLLRKISADLEICRLLGRNEPIIGGGTFFEAWSSAKMFAFVNHVQSYKKYPNKRVYHFEFDFQQMDSDTTVNDIQLLNRNRGSFHRQNIHEMYVRGEVDYSLNSIEAAKNTALNTPRGTPRRTSMVTPRETPTGTPKELSREPPMNSPRGLVSLASSSSSFGSAPPPRKSHIIKWFMATKGPSFNAVMNKVCNGLTYSNQLLVEISDIVKLHRMFFYEMTLNIPETQSLFLKKLSNCALIQRTVQASHLFRSMVHVAFADELIQMMFLEGLESSFYQEVKRVYLPSKQYILGISKISPMQDGNFSIELLPEEMIQDYLNQFTATTKGEQAPIA